MELVELDELRRACRLTDSEEDARLLELLSEAYALVEVERDETLLETGFELRLDSFFESRLAWPDCSVAGLRIPGPMKPLLAVSQIQYVDILGVTQTLSPSLYTVHPRGQVWGWIEPAYGESWPSTRTQTDAVIVTLTAGYGAAGAVPAYLRSAVKRLVKWWLDHEDEHAAQRLPESVRHMLALNRVKGFG